MAKVTYEAKKHYDFIKSDEAKEIFLNLEKENWLIKAQGYEKEDLQDRFVFDEEKKAIVKSFISDCAVCKGANMILRQQQDYFSYKDFNKFMPELVENLSLKKELDPDYVFEHWQVEMLRFFDEMDRICEDDNNDEFDHPNSYIFASLK